MQTDLPDDLKRPSELPVDIQGSLMSIREHAAYVAESCEVVVDAIDRLRIALSREAVPPEGSGDTEH